MSPNPFPGGGYIPRTQFLIAVIITIITNSVILQTEGRTWPRYVQQNSLHTEEIYSTEHPKVGDPQKKEIDSSLSPILPSPLHADSLNNTNAGSENASEPHNRSPHHEDVHRHSDNSRSNNDNYNGKRRWMCNSTDCMAGPFQLGADVNESVFNALCPFPPSTSNGK